MNDFSPELARSARFVAETLEESGHRAWLVGGSVRDLALGRSPKDVDLATAATPDEVEAAFDRTLAVGKAFGTILVRVGTGEVQVTTFRSDGGYTDGRRPDEVRYGATLEEDARRRDFTCNAMYLDPSTDELRDPEGGLEDLRRGHLVCVGDAAQRFSEDGLRLVRLARFAASLDLEVSEETLEAARAGAARLDGVSPERRLGELERIAGGPEPARALEILRQTEVLSHVLTVSAARGWEAGAADVQAVGRLGSAPGTEGLLATLLWSLRGRDADAAEAQLVELRPSRALLQGVLELWSILEDLSRLLERPDPLRPSVRVELVRRSRWPEALAVHRAFHGEAPMGDRMQEILATDRERDAPDFAPEPWIQSKDLAGLGLERGPRWGELLRDAYRAQLDGDVSSRDEALEWLRERAAVPGN